jgi:hypothetical protein
LTKYLAHSEKGRNDCASNVNRKLPGHSLRLIRLPNRLAKGRRQLAAETRKWDKLAGAIARILRPAEQEGEL